MSHPVYPNLGMAFISDDGHIAYLAYGKQVVRNGNPDDGAYIK